MLFTINSSFIPSTVTFKILNEYCSVYIIDHQFRVLLRVSQTWIPFLCLTISGDLSAADYQRNTGLLKSEELLNHFRSCSKSKYSSPLPTVRLNLCTLIALVFCTGKKIFNFKNLLCISKIKM